MKNCCSRDLLWECPYIIEIIAEKYEGGPVGIETLSAALGEESETLEEVYEPFLIQEGFIQKTSRGRVLTNFSKQITLF